MRMRGVALCPATRMARSAGSAETEATVGPAMACAKHRSQRLRTAHEPNSQARWFLAFMSVAPAACAVRQRGQEIRLAHQRRPVVEAISTFEPGGVRVIHSGPVRGQAEDAEARLVTTPGQLRKLWDALGLPGSPAVVDFRDEVVVGASFLGGVCPDDRPRLLPCAST